jgi:2-polyprenyl-6-methoxyphenol hydroxylase-like FAD-dependent oxidoreductase
MTTPITILSAGLAGLSLSRALRARGIPFALYDRSSTPARHAYTIYLATETWRPLCRVLDVEEAVLRRRLGVSIEGQGDGVGTGGEGKGLRVHRGRLE